MTYFSKTRHLTFKLLLRSPIYTLSLITPTFLPGRFTVASSTNNLQASLQAPPRSTPVNTTTLSSTQIVNEDHEFTRSDPDRRQYRGIKLANGLKVLLVRDEQSDVEAGSMHVNAGHFDDPVDRAGLAHFHEHMLFLGTEKYPEENDYESFLSKNGGSTNAYTDMEDTNYYFSVAPLNIDNNTTESQTSSSLEGALDRLAQFFISPIFKEDAVERELRAVDSEYTNGISQDNWRQYQLLKSWCQPEHPFSKFGCGNYKTLSNGGSTNGTSFADSGGSSPRPALLKFWEDHYHAGNVQLCVVGQAALDDLQQTVEKYFNDLRPAPTTQPSSSTCDSPPKADFALEHSVYGVSFGPNQLGKIHHVVPLTDQRTLKITFATPPSYDPEMMVSRPHRAVSHILGHESPGSLHSLLNERGLINGLSTGMGVDTSDFSLFSVSLSLTPKGMTRKEEVLDMVFQWIALIKTAWKEGKLEAYHEELRQITDVNFKFSETSDPVDFVQGAAELLKDFEPKDILTAGATCGAYNEEVTGRFVERLVPRNAMIVMNDKEWEGRSVEEGWKEETWYRARYMESDMEEEVVKKWENPEVIDERLHLPKLNEFIATDFSIRCDDKNTEKEAAEERITTGPTPPSVLIDTPKLRLWHKMDRLYRVPKTYIKMRITTPNVYRTPRTMTLNRLYAKVLNDDLNSYVYDANMAGCSYRVVCTPTGYSLTVSGYSEKLPILLDVLTSRMLSLLSEMKDPSNNPLLLQRFEKAKINLLRETKNFELDSPYETANYNARVLMEDKAWHLSSYIEELEQGMAMDECATIAEESLTGHNKIEALCMGNISPAEAQRVGTVIASNFSSAPPLRAEEIPVFKSLRAPLTTSATGPTVYHAMAGGDSEENDAVEMNLQVGSDTTLGYRGIAILELIGYVAYNSAFGQLRTKEQLGYIVSAYVRKTAGGTRGLAVVVQSSVATPKVIESRVENWLAVFRQELEEMSEEQIGQEAGAIAAQLLERDTKLSDEVGRFWGEIAATDAYTGRLREPVFDRIEKLSKEFTDRSAGELKEDMIEFFDEYFVATAPNRRVVSSRVYSKKSKEEYEANVGKKGVLSQWEDALELKQFLGSWPIAPYWGDSSAM